MPLSFPKLDSKSSFKQQSLPNVTPEGKKLEDCGNKGKARSFGRLTVVVASGDEQSEKFQMEFGLSSFREVGTSNMVSLVEIKRCVPAQIMELNVKMSCPNPHMPECRKDLGKRRRM